MLTFMSAAPPPTPASASPRWRRHYVQERRSRSSPRRSSNRKPENLGVSRRRIPREVRAKEEPKAEENKSEAGGVKAANRRRPRTPGSAPSVQRPPCGKNRRRHAPGKPTCHLPPPPRSCPVKFPASQHKHRANRARMKPVSAGSPLPMSLPGAYRAPSTPWLVKVGPVTINGTVDKVTIQEEHRVSLAGQGVHRHALRVEVRFRPGPLQWRTRMAESRSVTIKDFRVQRRKYQRFPETHGDSTTHDFTLRRTSVNENGGFVRPAGVRGPSCLVAMSRLFARPSDRRSVCARFCWPGARFAPLISRRLSPMVEGRRAACPRWRVGARQKSASPAAPVAIVQSGFEPVCSPELRVARPGRSPACRGPPRTCFEVAEVVNRAMESQQGARSRRAWRAGGPMPVPWATVGVVGKPCFLPGLFGNRRRHPSNRISQKLARPDQGRPGGHPVTVGRRASRRPLSRTPFLPGPSRDPSAVPVLQLLSTAASTYITHRQTIDETASRAGPTTDLRGPPGVTPGSGRGARRPVVPTLGGAPATCPPLHSTLPVAVRFASKPAGQGARLAPP